MKAHSEDWILEGVAVAGKRKVGDPEEEEGGDYLWQGEAGLCWIDALGVRS